ncbi:MAG TPA: hypothetical protein VGO11_01750, partial [Chthoniobacteraceae bacterium]|nr:hypothetical protein [Chthoniobacteraceae bacterium]
MLLLLLLLPPAARAHVGSPNVFFEGKAGPHPVLVTIRPPASLPGPAQIDVHAEGEISRVTVRGIFFAAGEDMAPPAVEAERVAEADGLYHTSLWLLRKGAYSIQIHVDGAAGAGSVAVPLNSAAYRNPNMPVGLAATLTVLGVVLVLGALGIAWSASQHAWRPTLVTAVLLAGALFAGGWRWRAMDRDFRENALDRPLPVAAAIRTDGALRLLDVTPLPDAADPGWETLVADHGKLMHLFLVREADQAAFAHLHPVRRDARTFENVLPPLPAGDYRLYAEITLASGLSRTLISQLAVPAPSGPELPPQADAAIVNELWCRAPSAALGNAAQPYALDVDDSWHLGAPAVAPAGDFTQTAALPDGGRMVFANAGALTVDRETSLRFTVVDAAGRQVPLQPYIGMAGHAVLRRADGTVFTHLHPAGTISMGAQELFSGAKPTTTPMTPPPAAREVTFPYAFPREGNYRLWVQVRIGGRIRTGTFEVSVKPA